VNATPARFGSTSCGASTARSYGSAFLRSTVSVLDRKVSMYGTSTPASSAAQANRRSRLRGWATTSSRGASRSVPSMAASGAAASPDSLSGMNTMGRADT
jgi:hypothetical protein